MTALNHSLVARMECPKAFTSSLTSLPPSHKKWGGLHSCLTYETAEWERRKKSFLHVLKNSAQEENDDEKTA